MRKSLSLAAFQHYRPWRSHVAVDLGTAFFRVATERGAVVTIPTAHTPQPPLRCGVINDPQAVADLLRPFLVEARKLGIFRPQVVVGAPTDARWNEREALVSALLAAGAAEVEIVSEPQAAAIGAGLDLSSPYAQMLVDVGEGVTDCAIFREGKILAAHACRVGCGSLRTSVQERLQDCWDICLTPVEAEKIVELAGVGSSVKPVTIPLRTKGRNAGISASLTIRAASVQALLEPVVAEILAAPCTLLRSVPHALGCEVIESGILLSGGGALLPGLRERLAEATSIDVTAPRNPLDTVVTGLRRMIATGLIREPSGMAASGFSFPIN